MPRELEELTAENGPDMGNNTQGSDAEEPRQTKEGAVMRTNTRRTNAEKPQGIKGARHDHSFLQTSRDPESNPNRGNK